MKPMGSKKKPTGMGKTPMTVKQKRGKHRKVTDRQDISKKIDKEQGGDICKNTSIIQKIKDQSSKTQLS